MWKPRQSRGHDEGWVTSDGWTTSTPPFELTFPGRFEGCETPTQSNGVVDSRPVRSPHVYVAVAEACLHPCIVLVSKNSEH
jgi:hypothetical protein